MSPSSGRTWFSLWYSLVQAAYTDSLDPAGKANINHSLTVEHISKSELSVDTVDTIVELAYNANMNNRCTCDCEALRPGPPTDDAKQQLYTHIRIASNLSDLHLCHAKRNGEVYGPPVMAASPRDAARRCALLARSVADKLPLDAASDDAAKRFVEMTLPVEPPSDKEEEEEEEATVIDTEAEGRAAARGIWCDMCGMHTKKPSKTLRDVDSSCLHGFASQCRYAKSVGWQLVGTHLRQLRGSVSERRLPRRYAPDVEEKKLAERLRHVRNKAAPEQLHDLASSTFSVDVDP